MMNIVELKDIKYAYNDDIILDHLSLKIGSNTTIIAGNGCGKTTLYKILSGKLDIDGNYLINNKIVNNNVDLINKYISFADKDMLFNDGLVIDYIFDSLSKYYQNDELEREVNNIINYFKINLLLRYKISELEDEKKYYILIILKLINNPKFVIIDDLLCYLRHKDIEKIYGYAKNNNISIVDISSTLDNVLFSDYLICIYNKTIAMEGNTISCLEEEKLLKRLGYNLPFMVDLSIQLNYYDLIDSVYLDRKEMEKSIWK